LPSAKGPRWNLNRRWNAVLGLLADKRFDGLLDPPVPFDEAAPLLARLAGDSTGSLQTAFAYAPD
jgi:hypothetical protein